MKLYFDIGNSRCKYVIESSGKLSSIQYQTEAEINEAWLSTSFNGVTQCLVADVSNSAVCEIIELWCANFKIPYQRMFTESARNGVRCAYDLSASFGVDRWLTLLGAHHLFPEKHCLIVDAGTATTIDYIDHNGQHHGGWILAGVDTLMTSLLANTANVQAKPKVISELTFANNTSDGVNHAAWAASIGMVEQAYLLVMEQYIFEKDALNVVLTGGNAERLQNLFKVNTQVIDELIFLGMQTYS